MVVPNVQEVVRSEVKLAKAEIREEASKAFSATLLTVAGVLTAIWENIKGALISLAATRFKDYVAKLIPGFDEQFQRTGRATEVVPQAARAVRSGRGNREIPFSNLPPRSEPLLRRVR